VIGMTLQAAQRGFFDREAIEKKIDAQMKRVLSRFGAFVRQRDRSSIRYRKAVSAPDGPPSAHRSMNRTKTNKKGITKTQSVSPLREFIFFTYDDSEGRPGVVIGPTLLNGSKPDVLRIIEEGGDETFTDAKGRTITKHYRPRPHTGPAFQTELKSTLPGLLGE
jgi:hypothetical protein